MAAGVRPAADDNRREAEADAAAELRPPSGAKCYTWVANIMM